MNDTQLLNFLTQGPKAQSEDICANYHQNTPESVAANPPPSHKAGQLKTILATIKALGDATSEEVENTLNLPHQAVSAHFSDAKRLGLIVKVGKRLTRSGKQAGAWRVL